MSETVSSMTPRAWKRKLVLFLTSQTLSLFGSSLVQYAIIWHITLTARSGLIQTTAILSGFIPHLILSPFAGVWADRYDRRRLMMLADGGIALVTLGLALAFQSGMQDLGLLFGALALRAMGTAVQTPAVGAFLPQIVPQEELTRANGFNQTIQSAVMLVSPMVAAAALSFFPLQVIFYVDVVTAILAILVLATGVRVPSHAKALQTPTTSYFHDLKEGITYVRRHGFVARFFLYCMFFMFLAAPAAFLTPLQVTRSFGPEVWRLSAIEVVFSVGMMAGGILIGIWGGFANRVKTMVVSCIIFAVTTVGMGLVPWFWPYLVVMGICGIAMPLFNTPSTVLLQEQVEGDFLGRVFGVMGMVSSIMMPMGMLVFGPLADLVSIEWLLVVSGGALGILALVMGLDRPLAAHGVPRKVVEAAQVSD